MNAPENHRTLLAGDDDMRILRIREVMAICGLARSSLYQMIKEGRFPQPVKLGGRASGWIKSEIVAWVHSRIDDRNSI